MPVHAYAQVLLALYVPVSARTKYAINIGARDGKAHDPTYSLFAQGGYGIGYDGVESECDLDVQSAPYAQK